MVESVGGAASCPGVNKVRLGYSPGQHVRGHHFPPGIEGEAHGDRSAGVAHVERAEVGGGFRHLVDTLTVVIGDINTAAGVDRHAFRAIEVAAQLNRLAYACLNLKQSVVDCIDHIDVPAAVHRHAFGINKVFHR